MSLAPKLNELLRSKNIEDLILLFEDYPLSAIILYLGESKTEVKIESLLRYLQDVRTSLKELSGVCRAHEVTCFNCEQQHLDGDHYCDCIKKPLAKAEMLTNPPAVSDEGFEKWEAGLQPGERGRNL